MSAGIRSGVNCTRCATSPSTVPSVSTSRVLARPGAPTSSPWPPQRMAISVCSTTASWPMMRRAIISRACTSRAPVSSISAIRSSGSVMLTHLLSPSRGVARGPSRHYPCLGSITARASPTMGIGDHNPDMRPSARGPRHRGPRRRPPRPAAGASLEPAVLRRSRHAHRPRRHLVLPRHPDRAEAAGQALLLDPEARGRPLLPGHARGEGRHPRRRRPLRRRRLHRRGRRPRPSASPSSPRSRTRSPPAPSTRSASSATRSRPSPRPT